MKLRIGISSCLLGQEVRFDGGHKRDAFLTEILAPFAEWVPVCPEVELGLGIPRETIRLEGQADTPRLVAPKSGRDLTAAMDHWASSRLRTLTDADLDGYVLKKDSPSCGMTRVRLYGDDGRVTRDGVGAFARRLMDASPLLPVEEEGRLHDARLRDNFIERIFAYARWKVFRDDRPTRGGLVAFHTVHKLQVLAHEPKAYQELGRMVATVKGRALATVLDEYGARFMAALGTLATRGRHVNVLEHMMGYVSDALPADERKELTDVIADYRRELVPLVVPVTLLRHHVRRFRVEYLMGQTYLEPHPKELMLRNHV